MFTPIIIKVYTISNTTVKYVATCRICNKLKTYKITLGTITISIDDDTEKRFREVAKKKPGERKGYLGKATTKALECWMKQQTLEEIVLDALTLIRSGHHLGKHLYRTRNDIYD